MTVSCRCWDVAPGASVGAAPAFSAPSRPDGSLVDVDMFLDEDIVAGRGVEGAEREHDRACRSRARLDPSLRFCATRARPFWNQSRPHLRARRIHREERALRRERLVRRRVEIGDERELRRAMAAQARTKACISNAGAVRQQARCDARHSIGPESRPPQPSGRPGVGRRGRVDPGLLQGPARADPCRPARPRTRGRCPTWRRAARACPRWLAPGASLS